MNTAVTITAIIAAFLLGSVIVTAIRDVAQAKHKAAQPYPRPDGDHLVLGPEIFTDRSGTVISWKGVNYVRQEEKGTTS